MTAFETKPIVDIGTGIYTMPDVAAILGLPVAKVRRWLRSYWNAQFGQATGMSFSEGEGRELVVNFHTLIEFYVFYQLRDRGVSVKKIVEAHRILEDLYQTAYPFATVSLLAQKGGNVLFEGKVGELIRADESLQIVIKEILAPFCDKIEFGPDKLAKCFYPSGRNSSVVVDPRRRFGQPVIADTNITTETVFDLHRGGEPTDVIARIYDLTAKQVRDALSYHYRNAA